MPETETNAKAAGARRAFCADRTGATAVEFALVAFPLLLLILGVLQIGIYFMAKSALDSGVIKTAEDLRKKFNSGIIYTTPTGCTFRDQVANNSGTFVANDPTILFVEIQKLTVLDPAIVPVSSTCVLDLGTYLMGNVAGSVLALRAKYTPPSFLPGFAPSVTLYSSALLRRQLY